MLHSRACRSTTWNLRSPVLPQLRKRWETLGSWNDDDFSFLSLHGPDRDYRPTGLLALGWSSHIYLEAAPDVRSGTPRSSERIENMASEFAVDLAERWLRRRMVVSNERSGEATSGSAAPA